MLDLLSAYWVWIISVVIASGPAGYWSTRPPVARDHGVPSWLGWAALAFAIVLVVSILVPGQAGLYLDALLFLSFLCIKGFLAGAWLRRAHTRTQVTAAGAAEDAGNATEVKTAEDTPSDAEAKAAEEAPRAAEVNAVEDARRVAEVKPAEETCSAAAAEDTRRAAEVKTAEETRCAAKAKPSRKRAASQKSRPPKTRAAPPRRRSQGRRGRTSTAPVIVPP